MENIIVVVDDADYALKIIAPMKGDINPTCWVLLVCPPKLTRHIGRWVNKTSRDAWRYKWSQALVQTIEPSLATGGDQVHWRYCKGALIQEMRKLQNDFNTHRILDARRPKLGQDHERVSPGQPVVSDNRWAIPGGVAAMGAALLVASD